MKSKLALFLATLLFFNIIFPSRVYASSVQDQSKPIFGLTADQVVDKYNQLTDQQKTQVLRSIGNTSIFANSLFGNIFNSTFGVLDDAVKKLGDLFFQANGVVYKLGSSALAWVSRLIDKVFNNDLDDLNISQPVINDLYLNTRGLSFENPPFFPQPYKYDLLDMSDSLFYNYALPLPDYDHIYGCFEYSPYYVPTYIAQYDLSFSIYGNTFIQGILVDNDSSIIKFGGIYLNDLGNGLYTLQNFVDHRESRLIFRNTGAIWDSSYSTFNSVFSVSFSGDYHVALLSLLKRCFTYVPGYYLKSDNLVSYVVFDNSSELLNITNNTYYNYIYNIPDQTPLNVTNIVSNTAIDFSPANNIAYYLPDQYDIEQNFTVVNNYYISSGSAISSQGSIDVNLVSPSVIDVRIINPEDISSEVINENNNDIINHYDFHFGDLNITNSVGTGINNAKDNLADVVTTSSINAVAGFGSSGLPSKWRNAIFGFLALGIIALVITRRGIAH